MKNILKPFLAAVLLTGVVACDEDQDLMFVTPPASFNIITPQDGEAVVLNDATPDNPALTVAWEDVEYGTPTVVAYTVQVIKNGTSDWSNPVNVATNVPNNSATIDMATLNSAALDLGLMPLEAGGIDIRVMATVAGTQETFSNVVTYVVTPYEPEIPPMDLFLVGNATEDNWNNNAMNAPLFRDAEDQNIFYFTGYFNVGGFKVLSERGSWHPQYGATSDGVIGVSNADGSNEPGQIMVATAGYYQFMMNLNDNTYTLTPYDVSSAPSFASVGIIGAATPGGWSTDTDFTNSTQNPHLWRLSSIELTADVVKFRANDSWDVPGNWGSGTPVQGMVSVNGGDFQGVLEAGTYEVWFNDLDGRYIFMEL